jgi:hypothetical protein
VLLPGGDAVIFGDPAAVSVYLNPALDVPDAIVTVVVGTLARSVKLPVPEVVDNVTVIDAVAFIGLA